VARLVNGSGGSIPLYVYFTFASSCNHIKSFQIPIYAIWKLWSSAIGPMLFGGSGGSSAKPTEEEEETSKRQQKLRKRNEKGDSRVQQVRAGRK